MSRVKSSTAQLARLSEHMRTHPNMASGVANSLQERADLERQWMNLTDILNSLGGPIKTVAKWKQAWRDLRNNVKKKAAHNHQLYRGYGLGGTGDGPHSLKQLSKVEEQVFRIDGVDETMPTPGPAQMMVVPAAESRVYDVSTEPPNSASPVHSQTKRSVTPTQVYHIGGPSPAQAEKLVELLEKRRYLATGHDHTTTAGTRTRNAWIEISRILNNVGDGCIKDWRQWAKYWKVMKGATKRKANLAEAAKQKADDGVNAEDVELSELEQRILTVCYGSHSAAEDRRPAIDLFQQEESASSESVSPSDSSILQVKPGLAGCHTVMIVEEGLSQWDETAAAFVGEGSVREVLDSLPAVSLTTTPGNNHAGASIKDETMSSSEDDRVPGEITENESTPAVGSRDRLGGAQRRIPVTSPSQRRRTALPPQRTKRTIGAQQGRNLHASPRPLKARGGVSQRRSEPASLTERLVAIEERRVDAEHAIARSQEMFAQGHLKMAEALNKLTNTLGIFAQQLFDSQQDRRSSYNGG